jgi:deferrochelatase/peroxidase EfeB
MGVHRMLKPIRAYYPEGSIVSGQLTVKASGAVTSWKGFGVTSVTKESTAGKYTFVLDDPHGYLVGSSVVQVASSAADITFQILSEDVDNATAASRTIVLQCKAAAVATDVASGSVLLVTFLFADSKALGFGPART